MTEAQEQVKKDLDESLKTNDCHLEVDFVKDVVMGNQVLVYKIIIVPNGTGANQK